MMGSGAMSGERMVERWRCHARSSPAGVVIIVVVLVDFLHKRSKRSSGVWRAAGKCGGAGGLVGERE